MPKKTTGSRNDIEPKEMVYCKPMSTYVPIAFCLNGGPMNNKRGKCRWFKEIISYPPEPGDKYPPRAVIHNPPEEMAVVRHIAMKSEK